MTSAKLTPIATICHSGVDSPTARRVTLLADAVERIYARDVDGGAPYGTEVQGLDHVETAWPMAIWGLEWLIDPSAWNPLRDEIVATYRAAIAAGGPPDGQGGTRPWAAADVVDYELTAEDWDAIVDALGLEPSAEDTRHALREARAIVTVDILHMENRTKKYAGA